MVLQYYPGLQDLIAILLLHLESPSLASLVLKQIMESHLWMFCLAYENNEDSEGSFTSCAEDSFEDASDSGDDDCIKECNGNWDMISLAFFPFMKVLDKELHDTLIQMGDGEDDFMSDRVLVLGKVLNRWVSSWFCCNDTLPMEVVSRLVDFFLACHPLMPL